VADDALAEATRFELTTRGERVTALAYAARASNARTTLVLAHGAGAPQTHPFLVRMARGITDRGVDVVTFNFAYMEARRGRPDRNDALEACWVDVLAAVRAGHDGVRRLFLGGKSMGGRIASQVAASGAAGEIAGLVFLGYPLHPPGKPEQLRSAHLPRIRAPMLFVQGTRDAFGTPEELAPVVRGLSAATRVFVIEGGDHSFAVPKKSGATKESVMARVIDEVVGFVTLER
jgi:predicted alpha/beta-hydrolase family hydrolase